MPDQKRGEDSPDGAAVLLVGAAEDQDIGTGSPAGFAPKDPAAPLMDVHGRDTTPQTSLWPDEFWIEKRRLFADLALEVLYRASRGVPRTAAHLLRVALVCAHDRDRDFVDEDTMLAACDELDLITPQQDQHQPPRSTHDKSRK